MVAAESVGPAMKNLSIGIEEPGVGPAAHVVPAELCCVEGTKTLKWRSESMNRNGASRVTGLVASVVNGCGPPDCAGTLPKLWAGTLPSSPTKNLFQTPLLQPSRVLFLTMNCCCEPLRTVLPVNLESAMKPPLE